MINHTEFYIRGADNVVTLNLREDGANIAPGSWSRLEIWIGDLEIERTENANGVNLSVAGVLTITPAKLTEDDSVLVVGELYRVLVCLVDPSNTDGVWFGGDDSDDKMWFLISEKKT